MPEAWEGRPVLLVVGRVRKLPGFLQHQEWWPGARISLGLRAQFVLGAGLTPPVGPLRSLVTHEEPEARSSGCCAVERAAG